MSLFNLSRRVVHSNHYAWFFLRILWLYFFTVSSPLYASLNNILFRFTHFKTFLKAELHSMLLWFDSLLYEIYCCGHKTTEFDIMLLLVTQDLQANRNKGYWPPGISASQTGFSGLLLYINVSKVATTLNLYGYLFANHPNGEQLYSKVSQYLE